MITGAMAKDSDKTSRYENSSRHSKQHLQHLKMPYNQHQPLPRPYIYDPYQQYYDQMPDLSIMGLPNFSGQGQFYNQNYNFQNYPYSINNQPPFYGGNPYNQGSVNDQTQGWQQNYMNNSSLLEQNKTLDSKIQNIKGCGNSIDKNEGRSQNQHFLDEKDQELRSNYAGSIRNSKKTKTGTKTKSRATEKGSLQSQKDSSDHHPMRKQDEIDSNSNKTHVRAFNDRCDNKSNHNSHKPIGNQRNSLFQQEENLKNRPALSHKPSLNNRIKVKLNLPKGFKGNIQVDLGMQQDKDSQNSKSQDDNEADGFSDELLALKRENKNLKLQLLREEEEVFCRSSFDSEGSLFDQDLPDDTKKGKNKFGNKTKSVFEISHRNHQQPGVIGEKYSQSKNKKIVKMGSINERDSKNEIFSEFNN